MTKKMRKKRVMWWHNYFRCKGCGYSNNSFISDSRLGKGHIFESECAQCGLIGEMKWVKSILRKDTHKMGGFPVI
jgi:transcription elongation factor Elf1